MVRHTRLVGISRASRFGRALALMAGLVACATSTPVVTTALSAEALSGLPIATYALDPSTATIGFSVKPFGMPTVKGDFAQFGGALTILEPVAGRASLSATVATGTVDAGNDFYRDIMISEGWFNASEYPEAVFTGTLDAWQEGASGEVMGALTIRGITAAQRFDISMTCEGVPACPEKAVGFVGEAELSRAAFGMTEMTALVGDKVTLTVRGTLIPTTAQILSPSSAAGMGSRGE